MSKVAKKNGLLEICAKSLLISQKSVKSGRVYVLLKFKQLEKRALLKKDKTPALNYDQMRSLGVVVKKKVEHCLREILRTEKSQL